MLSTWFITTQNIRLYGFPVATSLPSHSMEDKRLFLRNKELGPSNTAQDNDHVSSETNPPLSLSPSPASALSAVIMMFSLKGVEE